MKRCCSRSRMPVLLTAILVLAACGLPPATAQGGWGGGPPSRPTGVWRGEWSSQTSGHRGPLGARIRAVGPDRYRALFYGRFAVVIPFAYRTTLTRVPGTSDLYHSAKRMPLLGTYRTTARISHDSFRADFVGREDRGVFLMSRRR